MLSKEGLLQKHPVNPIHMNEAAFNEVYTNSIEKVEKKMNSFILNGIAVTHKQFPLHTRLRLLAFG
jgi:hypothetical protein